MNTVLSVIVPVYQAEKYIDRCVNSILSSTYTDLDVLLINDGSTDQSASLCDAWAKKDHRVHVIHKENGGVSSARNEGILYAKGKYITFVDADDYIADTAYETALRAFTDDVCSVAYKTIICDRTGKPLSTNPLSGDTLVFPTPLKALEYYWYTGKNTAVWCRIFLRDILVQNNLFFDVATGINEEGFFMTNYYKNCDGKVIQLNHRFYYYVLNESSATHNITQAQVERILENYHILLPLCASMSSTCGENVKLRYVEILLRLRINMNQLNTRTKHKVRIEIKQYLHTYLHSKLVSKRRKYYAYAVFIFPHIIPHLKKILKTYSLKNGKSW